MKRILVVLAVLTVLPLGNAPAADQAVALIETAIAPVNGTNEVQTLTFGSGIASGTFKLKFGTLSTQSVSWSATNTTLVSNIDAALEKLSSIGTGGVTTAVGTMTAGIGTIT